MKLKTKQKCKTTSSIARKKAADKYCMAAECNGKKIAASNYVSTTNLQNMVTKLAFKFAQELNVNFAVIIKVSFKPKICYAQCS